jgi:uncharacterized membrane protein YfcA
VAIAEFLIFVVLGGLFGFAGGLFGIGGAFLAIPVLGIFAGLSEQVAQGTAIAMALPNVTVGLWTYARKGRFDRRIAATLALTALPVTYGAARVATLLPSATLRIAFAVFLLVVGLDMARRTFGRRSPSIAVLPWPFAAIAGAVCGTLSGFFGVGGAIVAVPSMTMFFGMTQLEAQGMSLAFSVPSAAVTALTYALASDVDWSIGIPLAIGGVSTVAFGVNVAHRLPERVLRSLFIGFLAVVAVALILRVRATGV